MHTNGQPKKRNDTMKRLIGIWLIVFAALTPAVPAISAENIKLAGFFGTFKGNGVSENRDSLYFGVTVRDLDVKIEPAGKGFSIEWTTVIRRGGDPKNPKVRSKTQRMTFQPAGKDKVYKATESGDPLSGQPYAWAYIKETALIIHIMSIDDNGAYQMQSYTRKLVPTGMEFKFERIRNDEPVRTVKGKLIKFAK
jgi:hypothetical protein